MHQDLERILYRESEIQEAIARLAQQVTAHYAGRAFTVVPVLKGSILFAADLVRRIPVPLELAFVAASSYRSTESTGELSIQLFPSLREIAGRDVLLVDDILDTGRTLEALRRELHARGANSVRTCVFLDKPERRQVDLRPDWSCFQVEDRFVVGYGLDLDGCYRNLPFVAFLKAEVLAARAKPAPGALDSARGGGG